MLGGTAPNLEWLRAQTLERLGRGEEALELLDALLEQRPNHATTHERRFTLLMSQGRIDEASASIDRAIELRPSDGYYFVDRAFLRLLQSDSCDQVRADLEQAMALAEAAPAVWNFVAWLRGSLTLGRCPDVYDPEKALEEVRRAIEYDPGNTDYLDTLGWILYRRGDFEGAHEALLESRAENETPWPLFGLSMTSWRLGRHEEARDYYRRAVARVEATHPRSPWLLVAKEEAATLLGVR